MCIEKFTICSHAFPMARIHKKLQLVEKMQIQAEDIDDIREEQSMESEASFEKIHPIGRSSFADLTAITAKPSTIFISDLEKLNCRVSKLEEALASKNEQPGSTEAKLQAKNDVVSTNEVVWLKLVVALLAMTSIISSSSVYHCLCERRAAKQVPRGLMKEQEAKHKAAYLEMEEQMKAKLTLADLKLQETIRSSEARIQALEDELVSKSQTRFKSFEITRELRSAVNYYLSGVTGRASAVKEIATVSKPRFKSFASTKKLRTAMDNYLAGVTSRVSASKSGYGDRFGLSNVSSKITDFGGLFGSKK